MFNKYKMTLVIFYFQDLMLLGGAKCKLMFPTLSMLDISNNQLKDIPVNIHELTNLSVLNLSGNSGE